MIKNLEHKEILLAKAKEDLKAAGDLARSKEFSEEIVLFHCQQAAEKALKAYLDSKGTIYPKIHDLEALLSLCIEKDPAFADIQFITSLTPYAIEIRYDEFIELPKDEVLEILKQTETALNFILGKL